MEPIQGHFDETRIDWTNKSVPNGADINDLDQKTKQSVNGTGGSYHVNTRKLNVGGQGVRGRFREATTNIIAGEYNFGAAEAADIITTFRCINTSPATVILRDGERSPGDPIPWAQEGSILHAYCESTATQTTIFRRLDGTVLFEMGNGDRDDGTWCTFIYQDGAWDLFQKAPTARLQWQLFTEDGSFQVPRGITGLWVLGCGGGGGGGGGRLGAANGTGGGGGAGAALTFGPLGAAPLEIVSVTIGKGGNAGAGELPGGTGGDTLIASIIIGKGAAPGESGAPAALLVSGGGPRARRTGNADSGYRQVLFTSVFPGNQCGGHGGIGGNDPATGLVITPLAGGDSAMAIGGVGLNINGADFGTYDGGGSGGGGGAGPWAPGGRGGLGGNAAPGAGFSAPPGDGVQAGAGAPNSGAGGGGGGAGGQGPDGAGLPGGGAPGGSGFLYLIWVK